MLGLFLLLLGQLSKVSRVGVFQQILHQKPLQDLKQVNNVKHSNIKFFKLEIESIYFENA